MSTGSYFAYGEIIVVLLWVEKYELKINVIQAELRSPIG